MQSFALSTASSSASAAAAAAASGCPAGDVGGAGGVPGEGGGAFGPAGHGGAQVLDRLERADRAAELAAGPGVAGGRAAAPGGDPGGFGGEQGRGQVADGAGAEAGELVFRRDHGGVEPDRGQLAGEVERGEVLDSDARLVFLEEEPRVAGRGDQRTGGPQQRAGFAGDRERAVRLADPGQRAGGERDAGPVVIPGSGAGEQQAGQHGGQHRAGGQGAGQLLERRGQVGHRAVERDGEDAEGGQVLHQRGDGGRFLRAGDGDRAGPLRPVAERLLQGLLLLRHRDRHGLFLPFV